MDMKIHESYSSFPPEYIEQIREIVEKKSTSKRAKRVIAHILKYGTITTEDLREKYGYHHPPRAIRDVKELGIPLEKSRIQGKTGRSIAAYRLAQPSQAREKELVGRRAWPKEFKQKLLDAYGSKCTICCSTFSHRYLQIDHRIPFEVAGEPKEKWNIQDYMLLCGSCNRAKSWSCEHCQNWIDHDPSVCQSCYWVNPSGYLHVALRLIRRMDISWTEDEIHEYEKLQRMAKASQQDLPDFVKSILKRTLHETEPPWNEEII